MVSRFGYSVEILKGLKTVPKMTYYKPNGDALPGLPSDPYHLEKYLKRGFTLTPPQTKPQEGEPVGFPCETCGKVLKTKLALAGHRRSHK